MFHLSRVLELIHGDLYGKILPPTPASNQYFLLLVDDRSRFMSVVLLSSKDQVDDAIQKFQVRAECRTGEKLRGLCTDRGGEFNSKNFAEYCLEHGVWRQLTMPYSPRQNGVVERRNGTVVGTAKSMMKVKSMPAWFSGEAILTAIYILNRLPTKSVEGATPFELWYGKNPLFITCILLAVLHVRNTKPQLSKLDDRGRRMVFIGYEKRTKAYRLYDPVEKKVHISRDVVFDEDDQWNWDEEDKATVENPDVFSVEYMVMNSAGNLDEVDVVDAFGTPVHSPDGAQVIPGYDEDDSGDQAPLQSVSPLSDDQLHADHNDAPLRLRSMESLLGQAAVPSRAVRATQQEQLHAVSAEEPATMEEAEQRPCWCAAMEEEMKAIVSNDKWIMTDLPA
jgi:hypothetical protein